MKKSLFKLVSYILVVSLSTFSTLLIISYIWVSVEASDYTYQSIDDLPTNRVGLVLGTSKFVAQGKINEYFKNRIEAAVALYEAGKVKYLIVSGDNSTRYYNEPFLMKKELIKKGVPAERIIPDYAGFRTLDSVVRCKKVFGQDKVTIISQKFHNERAIFIAHSHNIEAIAFNAADVTGRKSLKTTTRELFARVKVLLDIYVTDEQPKFLGARVAL
jgi:SanA protein